MTEQPVPLAVLAAELGCGTRDIERRLNGSMVRDDVGIRSVPRELARELVEERDNKLATQREQRDAQRASHGRNPHRDRVKALQAQQRDLDLGLEGLPLDARAHVLMTSSDTLQRLDAAGRRTDEFLSGEHHVHSLTERS